MTPEPSHRARPYQRFFPELRRRRVFHSLALYGAVAFGLLQGVDVLVVALRLPPWPTTVVALLAVAGFPVVSALAWHWQISREAFIRGLGPRPARPPHSSPEEGRDVSPRSRSPIRGRPLTDGKPERCRTSAHLDRRSDLPAAL